MDLMYELRNDPILGQWIIAAKTSRMSLLDYLVDYDSDLKALPVLSGVRVFIY